MFLIVGHGVMLTATEMVEEMVKKMEKEMGMVKGTMEMIIWTVFCFEFLVIELREVKVCEPFVSQFQKGQHRFPDIRPCHS